MVGGVLVRVGPVEGGLRGLPCSCVLLDMGQAKQMVLRRVWAHPGLFSCQRCTCTGSRAFQSAVALHTL